MKSFGSNFIFYAGVSGALVSQVDLLSSLSVLTGQNVPPGQARDSQNILPALLGEARAGRSELVEYGDKLGIVSGSWKYITSLKDPKEEQLFDLSQDIAEQRNLAAQNPGKVEELAAQLKAIREGQGLGSELDRKKD